MIQRYAVTTKSHTTDDKGEWVKAEEHEAQLAAKEAELEETQRRDDFNYRERVRLEAELLAIHEITEATRCPTTSSRIRAPSEAVRQMAKELSASRAIIKGVHGALNDASDIPVPAMDADLYEAVMQIVRQRDESHAQVARLREAVEFFCGHIVDCSPHPSRIVKGWQDFDYDGLLASLPDQSKRDAEVLRLAEELSDVAKRRNDDCLTGALITPEIDAIYKIILTVREGK